MNAFDHDGHAGERPQITDGQAELVRRPKGGVSVHETERYVSELDGHAGVAGDKRALNCGRTEEVRGMRSDQHCRAVRR
ncbi:UNVERIFIED_CONTAM: hypothetical protein LK11_07040 [Mumia flava]